MVAALKAADPSEPDFHAVLGGNAADLLSLR
jgi:hypothetical protein